MDQEKAKKNKADPWSSLVQERKPESDKHCLAGDLHIPLFVAERYLNGPILKIRTTKIAKKVQHSHGVSFSTVDSS